MIFVIALVVTAVFLFLCAKPMKAHPAPFYLAAALLSAAVIALYWMAPDFLSITLRNKLPIWLSAFGTACFVFVMFIGALPNGHPVVKRLMPIRGELSIFACLLTLGHNLSFGKNYLTPGYLFSGPFSPTKVAAWVSVVSILLMLVLTVTSIKAVRKRFQPKKWKALQRWAYLFYALVYIHVLLLNIPNVLKGRSGYGLNLLVYSVVYLSYALCRIQKAVLLKRRQASQVTGRRQLAAAGVGVVLSLILFGGTYLTAAAQSSEPTAGLLPAEGSLPVDNDGPSSEPDADSSEAFSELPSAKPSEGPDAENTEEPPDEPSDEPSREPDPSAEPTSAPTPAPTPSTPPTAAPTAEPTSAPTPAPTPAPEPTPTPAPASKYKDGTFTGTGMGYDGPVTVSVTISGDKITKITITSYVDDDEYMDPARSGVITSILLLQSTDVSAVSGATYSSEGIMEAVDAALKSAAN